MKRASLLFLLLLLAAVPMSGADDWGDYYSRGLDAVRSQDWSGVKASMESAIALKPVAQSPARWKNKTFKYIPHYYLGVALVQLGDIDGALNAFDVEKSQGVIQRTEFLQDMIRWEAEAQKAKGRSADEAVTDVRKAAENAISDATIAKAGAVGAGADRSEDFQKATRLLNDAVATLNRSGIDAASYQLAEQKAREARGLFETAQKNIRSRPVVRPAPPPKPAVDPAVAAEEARLAKELEDLRTEIETKISDLDARLNDAEDKYQDDAEFQTFVMNSRSQAEQWDAMAPATNEPAELRKISQSVTSSIEALAQQTAALRAAAAAKAAPPPAEEVKTRSAEEIAKTRSELKRAWSSFVKGDVDECEKIANQIVESRVGSSDAYMLRGIASYTIALTTEQEDLLASAAADFANAVRISPSAKMDKRFFSPKLVAFFEQVRKSSAR